MLHASRQPSSTPAISIALALVMTLASGAAVTGCSNERAPISADVVGLLSGDAEGYARVLEPREIVFPRDHGAHPEYRSEWWYFTGNLVARTPEGRSGGSGSVGDGGEGGAGGAGAEAGTAAGRRFGFQFTIFRSALDPAPDAPESAWGSGQAYLAHFALTDVEAETFHSAERLSRGDAGLAGAEPSPLRVWVETWEIAEIDPDSAIAIADGDRQPPDRSPAPDHAAAPDGSPAPDAEVAHGPIVRLRAAARADADSGPAAIDLVLTPVKPPALHGQGGFSPKGPEPGNASFYYSFTRQRAAGHVTTAEGDFEVEGEAWMDHEWSTSALAEDQTGWDWLSLQLSDGRELMVFHLREADGGIAAVSSGSVVDAAGGVRHLARDDFELVRQGEWTSPLTGARYPAAWRLALPDEGLELEVSPLVADQELDVSIRYWEGAVRATGRDARTGGPIDGYGYLEMTGYARSAGGRGARGE